MNHVRRLRQSRNLSQAQLAMLLGVLPGTVGDWERDESIPHPRTRRKLAKQLGVSEEELGFPEQPPRGGSR